MFGLGLATSKVDVISPTVTTSTVVVLRLQYTSFQPGRDGQTCIVYEGKDVICIIRPSVTIILTFAASKISSRKLSQTFSILFELRGNMFQDKIYSHVHEIYVDIDNEQFALGSESELKTSIESVLGEHIVVPITLNYS